MKNIKLVIIVGFIATIIGVIAFWPRTPVDVPVDVSLTEKTRIGVNSPTDEDLPKYEFITNLAQDDINKFCNESNLETQFEFILTSGQGQAGKALENTSIPRDGY